MNKITKYAFNSLYELSSGISTNKKQSGKGYPFLSFKTVFNNYFLPETLQDLMLTTDKDREVYSIRKGDIFLTRTSETIDELAMSSVALKDYPQATYSGFLKRLRPKSNFTPYYKYIAFYLRSPLFRKLVTNNAFMTLRASFNEDIFSFLDLYLPEYKQQVCIGDLLYSIEKKIQLNKKIAFELESMAKVLYDYWFVQFDFPDENGKPYRSSGREMVWNEELKREIPKGWKFGKLCELADITMGQSPSGDSYNEEGIGSVFYQGCTDFGSYFPLIRKFTTNPTRFARKGDILISVRAPVGSVNIAFEDCCIGRGLAAIRNKFGCQIYIFYTLKYLNKSFNIFNNNGTTFGALTKDLLFGMDVVIPDRNVSILFGNTCKYIENKMLNIEKETRELTKLRDWLIPMLMNGQVCIRDGGEKKENTLNSLEEEPLTEMMASATNEETPVRKKRGRPRKNPFPQQMTLI